MLIDETVQKNLTDEYIMEFSKLKHLQCYITAFEIEYRTFELNPQRQQLSTTFQFTIEEVFETLEKGYVNMTTFHSVIDPIVNVNLEMPFIANMYQTNVSMSIKLQVVIINTDTFRDQGNPQFHT